MSAKKFFEIVGTQKNINEFIQKLPLAVCVINQEREILSYNRAFFLMAGRELRQGTRYCYEFLNFPFCHSNCLAHMATKLGRTVTWDETRGQRKDGDELIIRPTVIPYTLDDDGEVQGHILIFQNTTDEVHLYRNFRANLDHLERKVEFLQTLNDAADKFRQEKQVDALKRKITGFAVNNMAVECCQMVEYIAESEAYEVSCTSTSVDFTVDPVRSEQLLKSVEESLFDLKESGEPLMEVLFDEENTSPAKQCQTVMFPIRSGSQDFGTLVVHSFSKNEVINTERQEYLELYAKSVGPYIQNCHFISNLEGMVADRTRELQSAQAQLMESTRLASVGEIAGMVAHEVLNPMTAVLARIRKMQNVDEGSVAMIKMVADGWNDDMQKGGVQGLIEALQDKEEEGSSTLIEEDLSTIQGGVEDLKDDLQFVEYQLNRIVGIVDNLRGLSRSRNVAENIDVREAIEKTQELTLDGRKKRKIELTTEYNHQTQVHCDLNELIQVIHNLVRNAVQAIEHDGLIKISTQETEARVEIRIEDSAGGVPTEIVPKIFEMRFTTKDSKEGTGIGLNLSRRLMRQVHGDVELESPGGADVGHGAVFLCWIPKNQKRQNTSSA